MMADESERGYRAGKCANLFEIALGGNQQMNCTTVILIALYCVSI